MKSAIQYEAQRGILRGMIHRDQDNAINTAIDVIVSSTSIGSPSIKDVRVHDDRCIIYYMHSSNKL
jgi:hypothetical protein